MYSFSIHADHSKLNSINYSHKHVKFKWRYVNNAI